MKKFISATAIIALALALLCSCAQPEPPEMATCAKCGREYLEEYTMRNFQGESACPVCVQEQVAAFAWGLDNAMTSLAEDGIYFTDYDFMLVAATMCNHCGEWAPAMLRDPVDEPICIDCMNDAIQNKNVAKALDRYFEYG